MLINRDSEQTHMSLGVRIPGRSWEHRWALSVLNGALGGGLSSRLFQEIRETRGLAYSVYSTIDTFSDCGAFSVYAGCLPERFDEVVRLTTEVLATVARDGITDSECRIAKGSLRGALVLGLEDSASRMNRLGRSELNYGEYRTISDTLQRIDDVTVTKTTFTRPADFSPEKFFANALGVMGGTGDHRVVIRFTAAVAERVREREWHESQEMRDLPGGALELRLRLGALSEAEQWILSWGAAAEVLAPAERLEAALADPATWWPGVVLREHQIEALDELAVRLRAGASRTWIDAPTGSGKTITFCALAAALDGSAVILVPRRNLAEQTAKALSTFFPDVRFSANGVTDIGTPGVTICTYQAALRHVDEANWGDVTLLICDEAHTTLGQQTRKMIDNAVDAIIVGFTCLIVNMILTARVGVIHVDRDYAPYEDIQEEAGV
jgi:hypothetical protein